MVRGWGDVFHSMRGQVELPGGSAPVYRVEFNNMSRGHLFVTPALSGRGRTGPDGGVDGWRHVARENMLKTEDPKSLRPGHLGHAFLAGATPSGNSDFVSGVFSWATRKMSSCVEYLVSGGQISFIDW